MTANKDYIPRPDVQFNGWANNLYGGVTTTTVVWNIPADEIIAYNTKLNKWNEAFAVGGIAQKSTRTDKQTQDQDKARIELEEVMRLFVKRWLTLNPAVSDADRKALQVPIYDGTRTPEPKPTTIPLVEITPMNGAMIEIIFSRGHHEDGNKHKGKPAHTHGMKIYYKVGDPAPATFEDCNKSVTATKSPYLMKFSALDTGQKVYYYFCWVNSHEEEGPVTPVKTALVPL